MTKQEKRSQEYREQRIARGDVFEIKIPGHHTLREGALCTFKGFGKQEFTFFAARVVDGECVWLQVVGGKRDRRAWHHFTPDKLDSVKRSVKK